MKSCECGCGEPASIYRGIQRRFATGHQARKPSAAQVQNRLLIAERAHPGRPKGITPWNKGRVYLIAKRTSYATKGAWMMAARRLLGTACMRCGWAEGPCDVHHVIPKAKGGCFTLDNAVVICPNCHRLAHVDPSVQAGLSSLPRRQLAEAV